MSMLLRFFLVMVMLITSGCLSSSIRKATTDVYASPDGSAIARIQGTRVTIDGFLDKRPLDGVAAPGVVFSKDGNHWAYLAIRGGKVVLIADGKEFGAFDNYIINSLAFRGARSRLVFLGKRGEKWMVVVDGKEGLAYDGLGVDAPIFSQDGSRIAYNAKRGDKWMVVLDGQEGPEFNGILKNSLMFLRDSTRPSYAAIQGGKWAIVTDGKESPVYDNLGADSPIISPDGFRVAYIAKRGEKWMVVVDGQEGPYFDGISKSSPMFSPDSRRLAYAARRGGKWVIFADGQESPDYEEIFGLVFLADNSFVYARKAGDAWSVERDYLAGPRYEWIRQPGLVISPNRTRFAYVGYGNGRYDVVIDGSVERSCKEFGFVKQSGGRTAGNLAGSFIGSMAASLLTAPLGVRVHFFPSKTKKTVYSGGIQFSPDSNHYAYVVKEGRDRLIIIDGVKSYRLPVGTAMDGFRFSAESDKVHVQLKGSKEADAVIPVPGLHES